MTGVQTCALPISIFIWLYVDAVRKICLEKRGDEPEDAEPAGWILRREKSGLGAFSLILGCIVAALGLFRAPVSDLVGEVFQIAVAHGSVHPAFWIYYSGAFATGFSFLSGWRHGAWLGTNSIGYSGFIG